MSFQENRLERASALLAEARQMAPHQRAGFLSGACGSDAALQTLVNDLLVARERQGDFLRPRGEEEIPGMGEERPHARIGRYELLECIGEGGFGTVWMAGQEEPVRRRVALKIIKLGMDTRQVMARFEQERQALAMMDHPHIARVLDAGATDAGRPYFVMELVRGRPITGYSDEQRLPLSNRLELFVDVCRAIQHAHTKGIIHRDVKPSNVLVSRHDDKPVVKVIDFGIAKATVGRLTQQTLFTEFRQLIGTPAYMSPEQAGMSDRDVDTRSDIYSLGVLLYELLIGVTPFDRKRLVGTGPEEMCRIIREEEPPRPSTRVSAGLSESRSVDQRVQRAVPAKGRGSDRLQHETAQAHPGLEFQHPELNAIEVAALRRTDPRSLLRALHGDLDWIVLKCLEKDRARRYETANDLAEDLQRHLAGEAVLAAPPDAAYRLRKFVRRNRVAVGTVVGTMAALLVAVIGTSVGLVRAQIAEGQEREQRKLAVARALETQQVANFQSAILSELDVWAMGQGIKRHLREQVRLALERQFVGGFSDRRKRSAADVEAALAAFDEGAGAAQAADVARPVMDEFVLRPAADGVQRRFENQPLVRAQIQDAIGVTYDALGMSEHAVTQLRAALKCRSRSLGEDSPETLETRAHLGDALYAQNLLPEAEACYREVLERRQRLLGDEHPDTLRALGDVGAVLWAQGKLSDAEPYWRTALNTARRTLGGDNPTTLSAIHHMAFVLQTRGQLDEAESLHREAAEGFRRAFGHQHSETLGAIHNLGFLLQARGKLAEAASCFREVLDARRALLGGDHPDTLKTLAMTGNLLELQGTLAEAESLDREAVETSRRVLGDEHPQTLACITSLGHLLVKQGQAITAIAYVAPFEALARQQFTGSNAFRLARLLTTLGRARTAVGEFEAALANLTEAHERLTSDAGPTPMDRTEAVVGLAELYEAWDAVDAGRGFAERAAEWRAKLSPAE